MEGRQTLPVNEVLSIRLIEKSNETDKESSGQLYNTGKSNRDAQSGIGEWTGGQTSKRNIEDLLTISSTRATRVLSVQREELSEVAELRRNRAIELIRVEGPERATKIG